nr:PEP-CTERM sorting domain-containing protein [Nitrosomonas aestuarii]
MPGTLILLSLGLLGVTFSRSRQQQQTNSYSAFYSPLRRVFCNL